MAQTELVQSFDARQVMYGLDQHSLRILSAAWPTIAEVVEPAVEQILVATRVLPRIGEIVRQNADLFRKLEVAHFRTLLGGKLDQRYAESCRDTVAQEAALGLDARFRSTAGSYVLKGVLEALARKHRFSAAKAADTAIVVSKVIHFDVSNAMTLHRQAREQAALLRQNAIDAAIAEFAGAIGGVVDAIKEAAVSLSTTCATLN